MNTVLIIAIIFMIFLFWFINKNSSEKNSLEKKSSQPTPVDKIYQNA